jgi:NADPH-dependent 2,4-dienoyl-CoA reductase/sulfur reductase-like enzyme
MRHLILGAGPAGVIAAETLRKVAPYDSVTIVGDEPEAPYSRMAIPYLLAGNIAESGTHLRHGANHYGNRGIAVQRGRAVAVDAKGRTVTLDNGSVLGFDTLLVATGSSPGKPPIRGIDHARVQTCWTLADARNIMQLAKPGSKVVQMGAGFIGCIIMEGLAARGVQLSVVEMGDRMVPRMMGPTAGAMIKEWCEKKGVRVYTAAKVDSIDPAAAVAAARPAPAASPSLLGRIAAAFGLGSKPAATNGHAPAPAAPAGPRAALAVRLSTGQTLEADLVINATGVRPNIGFLNGSGVKCATGVLTDERMRSNEPGIYAAGDCAEALDLATGTTVVSAIQPNAADQAYVAAMNMAGRNTTLKRVPQINVLDTLGLISTSFGQWQGVPGGQQVELTDRPTGRHLSLQFFGDRMVGCNSIGWTDHVGVMRGLVEGQVRLGDWKERLVQDPTQLMAAYLARAQAQDARQAARH